MRPTREEIDAFFREEELNGASGLHGSPYAIEARENAFAGWFREVIRRYGDRTYHISSWFMVDMRPRPMDPNVNGFDLNRRVIASAYAMARDGTLVGTFAWIPSAPVYFSHEGDSVMARMMTEASA